MNIIGIYPGSFQPPHGGHYRAYEYLKKLTGVNTFVTTSDVLELPQSPLSFQDKQQIWTRHGVPIDKVVKTKDPNKAQEVTQKFGPDRTIAIFAMPKKEAQVVLQSSNGYFIPFRSVAQATSPLSKNAYVLVIPDEILFVNKSVNNQTIRQAFGSKTLPEEKKKSFFKQIFGWYDISLFDLIKKKFAEASTVKERMNESYFTCDECEKAAMPVLRRTLKAFVKEIVDEWVTPQGDDNSTLSNASSTQQAMTPGEIAKQKRDSEHQRDQALKQKEAELNTARKEREFQSQKLRQINKWTIPNTTTDIQKLKGAKI